MSFRLAFVRVPAFLAACTAIMVAGIGSTAASVISATPTLPVIGASYMSSIGAGCFPAAPPAGVCISPGTLTVTSLISSTFDSDSQDIKSNVSYASTLTQLDGITPIGLIQLTGTMEEDVLGRLSDVTGSWTTNLLVLSLTGFVGPNQLTLMLDSSHVSTGQTSITALDINDGPFRIDSFFDIFVDLTLTFRDPTQPPLHTTRGPIHAELVPEPGSLALLVGALAALASRRRQTAC